jgi:hypothetical protein
MTASAVAEALPVATGAQGAQRSRCALRPVVVAVSLAELRGPASGLVELPQRLFWSGERIFDLSDSEQLLSMYEAVFEAARTQADLAEYLNGETLARVWPQLGISSRARRAWEAAHPCLGVRLLPAS